MHVFQTLLLLLLAAASKTAAKPRPGFTGYPSWNWKMYPLWRDGDRRLGDAWRGGKVTFNVGNDSPTLTGAKVTFTIDLEFPHSQKLQPDGAVVWAEDGSLNGTKYRESEPVYSSPDSDWQPVFPDGKPIKKEKKPAYVFVWKTRGQYWQVADGASSSLTVGTDGVPLGSYTMDIVVYHYRSREKFIPLGYASTQFSITDQIPFAVSLDQVSDAVAGDLHFIQNRAIAFSIALHDPSQYLRHADVTFNWDFGDESGALISRELTVTHTYVRSGSFKPQVVIQAVIPDEACDPPSDAPTDAPGPPADRGTTAKAPARQPAAPLPSSTGPAPPAASKTPSDTEEDNTEDDSSSASSSLPAPETPTASKTPPPMQQLPGDADGSSSAAAGKQRVSLTGRSAAAVASRDAERPSTADDCVIYRYGSSCTGIQVSEGIEKVEIVQMDSAVVTAAGRDEHVLDVTVACQGSLPTEVCSVMLEPDCRRPVQTACNMVEPGRRCLMVLRHFFNDSGVYCVNVSMSNDFSLAVTSAKVTVHVGAALLSSGLAAMLLAVLLLLLAAAAACSLRRFKAYRPLKEAAPPAAPPSRLRSLLSRRTAVDGGPLLQGALL